MQNGIRSARSVFERLEERNISIAQIASFAYVGAASKPALLDKSSHIKTVNLAEITACIENALVDPDIAGFIESAFAISDAGSRNLVSDNSLFNKWCLETAGKIAGKKIDKLIMVSIGDRVGSPLSLAFSAILTGVVNK
jgi:hypothetical protein